MSQDNINEANACYVKAEKALKTGLMKWTPDYEIAANEYSKAATLFRTAKMAQKCIEANLKAANCYEQSRSFFSAAKCYEQCGMLTKELNDYEKMIHFYDKACSYYREHGIPDTAALTYNKAAGILETIKPEKSAEWYGLAYEVVMNEDRYLQAAEYANKAVRLYLKLKQYENAVRWSECALESYSAASDEAASGRQSITTVLIQLARDDPVAAQKVYTANKCNIHQEERYLLDSLFKGLDDFDNASIYSTLKSPFFQNLDNEVVKMVRELYLKYEPKKSAEQTTLADASNIDEESGAML